MLWNLYIENIAVAKQLEIQFRDGFTVLTGKTGAGKSIIIDSLLLLCGAKNAKELIRSGEDRALVSAIFSVNDAAKSKLAELGYEPDENGEIELSRAIGADGRSTAKINRRTVPLSVLRDIAPALISIQTQSERNDFADRSTYTGLLDSFSDAEELLSEYKTHYDSLTDLRGQIANLKKAMTQREMMLDILKYQKKEIDSAKLSADDEEEKLIRLRTKLRSIEKVSKYSSVVSKALAYSEKGATAAYLMERAEAALEQLSDVVEDADDMISRLRSYRYEIIDIAERVKDALDDGDIGDPAAKLTQVESRLTVIERMKKKYGETIAEIKAKRTEIASQIADLEDGDFRISELEKQLSEAEDKAYAVAREITSKRQTAAERLSAEIIESLKFLDMPKVRFRISVMPMKDGAKPLFKADGIDDVDLLISVNTGEELQSLGKVSSGGELSRITLAIKSALAGKNDSGTIVFDEIDAGVSGGTSERIGMMLDKLSKAAQVISVTHSSQIASIADCHLLIEKSEIDGRTESSVREITGDERTAEIARIIGGIDVTEKQKAAAREMLNKNNK
ncbi:MAG: DNA repair protein RecN [Ruminococcaceae bacterium]|nr:DNA repair protein RecN [Oscillospiraceae bacterium]